MKHPGVKNVLEIAVVIIFFSALTLSVSRQVQDPDTFWHLKTGEWIWQNKALPDKDPFSYTPELTKQADESAWFILTQYWLAQLIMYGFYRINGFYGIVLLRCLIYLGIGLMLYYWMAKEGLSRMNRLLVLMPAVYFSSMWLGERPNTFSFLFTVVIVYLLEDMRKACSRPRRLAEESVQGKEACSEQRVACGEKKIPAARYLLLPLLMLLWANMHGGFILGDAIIAIYALSEVYVFFDRRRKHREAGGSTQNISGMGMSAAHKLFFGLCLVSILISFINPNTYKVVFTLFSLASGKNITIPVSEHMSPFSYIAKGEFRFLIIACLALAPFLLMARRLKLHSAVLMAFLAVLAFSAIRYIPFFVYVSIPFAAILIKDFFDGEGAVQKRIRALRMPAGPVILLLTTIFIVFMFSTGLKHTVFSGKNPLLSNMYPEKAVKFIKTEKPEGELFNDYANGGYLIWSLYPEYKVFMDGRKLYQSMELAYVHTLRGASEDFSGMPLWKSILNSYKINTVLVSGSNVIAGSFNRLVRRLVEDEEWKLVFVDAGAVVFVRDTERNREIIKKYSRPKFIAYDVALRQSEGFRQQYPGFWMSYATLGEINLYLGRPKTAVMFFEAAFKLNLSLKATALNELLEKIKAGEDYGKLLDKLFG